MIALLLLSKQYFQSKLIGTNYVINIGAHGMILMRLIYQSNMLILFLLLIKKKFLFSTFTLIKQEFITYFIKFMCGPLS